MSELDNQKALEIITYYLRWTIEYMRAARTGNKSRMAELDDEWEAWEANKLPQTSPHNPKDVN